jgi:hypothetical protein
MEDWTNKWLQNQADIIDIINLEDDSEEWNECYKRGILVDTLYTYQNWLNKFEELTYKQIELLDEKQQLLFLKKTNILKEYMFITINPKPGTSLKTFYDKLMKLFKSKYILDYLMVIEQRSDNVSNAGNGLHTHFLIKNQYPKFCKLKKHLLGLFGDIVGNELHINIKSCNHSTDVSNRKEYMIGLKKTEEKQKKQTIDRIYRLDKGIDDYYGNINIENSYINA